MTLDIVIFGLSITSSWGNGHASTYRALIKALARRGHRVTFLERDVPWYRDHRDLPDPDYARVELYRTLPDIAQRCTGTIVDADLVILGSYVPDGRILGDWITSHARGITAFYDIDTPVTLAKLDAEGAEYLSASLIPRFDLYLSFTGGPTLRYIENHYGSRRACALYCAADPDIYVPRAAEERWTIGYLGTYSEDRDSPLKRLLIEPAALRPNDRFAIAGAQYPVDRTWPRNIEHFEHIAPSAHAGYYASQRYTLNITRADMIARGYSPSVRLFEAAACGTPIISDRWSGLDTLFAEGDEILIADDTRDVLQILDMSEDRRRSIAAAARKRLIDSHSAAHRARDLEHYYLEAAQSHRVDVKEVVA